ncbi:MAG: hypothetical protein HFH37_06405 [Lachnospiraceae bacterium]|nr:hypothetical protein [Lachnospiraceae bacterium]
MKSIQGYPKSREQAGLRDILFSFYGKDPIMRKRERDSFKMKYLLTI